MLIEILRPGYIVIQLYVLNNDKDNVQPNSTT